MPVHLAGELDQRVGVVQAPALEGDRLASAAQVGGGEVLLAGGMDGDAGRI